MLINNICKNMKILINYCNFNKLCNFRFRNLKFRELGNLKFRELGNGTNTDSVRIAGVLAHKQSEEGFFYTTYSAQHWVNIWCLLTTFCKYDLTHASIQRKHTITTYDFQVS